MNDVTRTILANSKSDLVEKLSDEPAENYKVTYVNGRLVMSDDMDKAVLKNFKVCGAKKIIQEELDNTETEFDDVRYNIHVPGVK